MSASRSVLISSRVQANFMATSAEVPGLSISTYAILFPYLGSVLNFTSFEKERSLMLWTVESWGTGSQTRSFFVPAGISRALPRLATRLRTISTSSSMDSGKGRTTVLNLRFSALERSFTPL